MNSDTRNNLVRIGVFYDGNFFYHVSNYYSYAHERRARISIDGLHRFIRNKVAEAFEQDLKLCQIVDAHYFRGRLSAAEASSREKLIYHERVFDDILVSSGVTTHYSPLKSYGGKYQEKGIDVWLALEAYELAFYKHFNVVVLIAGDGDYVPLIRKLNTLGTRVMVLGWDFETVNDYGKQFSTRTSHELLEEVTYPIAMHEVINDPANANNPIIDRLFVFSRERDFVVRAPEAAEEDGYDVIEAENEGFGSVSNDEDQKPSAPIDPAERFEGEVFVLKEGYGFIGESPNGTFFHYSDLTNCDFNELQLRDRLSYLIGYGPEGRIKAVDIVWLSGE